MAIGRQVRALAKSRAADVSKATIIDPRTARDLDDMVALLTSLRKSKGMTEAKARELLCGDFTWCAPHPPPPPPPCRRRRRNGPSRSRLRWPCGAMSNLHCLQRQQ